MSAFGGKADIVISERHGLLLTQSGHQQLRIAAVQTDPPGSGEDNVTTRFHQKICVFSVGMAARRARTTQTADAATNFGVKFNVRVTSASPPRGVDVQIRG